MKLLTRILVGAVALIWNATAFSAPTLVQSATPVNAASSASTSISLSGVASGDYLILQIVTGADPALSSVTDSTGDTVASAVPFVSITGAVMSLGVYYVHVVTPGPHTIAVALGAAQNTTLFLSEYSGIASTGAVDAVSAVNSVASGVTSSITTAAISPTANGDLIIFAIGQTVSGDTFSAYGSGFTQQQIQNASGPSGAWASVVQATAAPISGSATSSTTNAWGAAVVAFKAASAAPSQKGGMFFADNFRPKIPVVAAAMFMPLSWTINRRNKRAGERR